MFIYLIVNHVTGKYYVGQHKGTNLKKYLQDKLSHAKHKRAGSSYLFNSMRKHLDHSVWSIHALLSDVQTRAELDQYERDFIAFLKSQDPEYGYNICRGGEGFSGSHSAATRQKIAKASARMWQRADIRENFTNKVKGVKKPEGFGEATAKAQRGKKVSAKTIEKLRISHIGIASPRRKRVRDLNTGEVFPSLTEITKRFGGCTTNLSRAIKEGYKFCGKTFEYI